MENYLIVYHKEDNDGVFSCALAYSYLYYELSKNGLDIHYYSADYNDMSKISIEEIEKELMEWLQKQTTIEQVLLEEFVIKVIHKSGLESYVMLENPRGTIGFG